jgi:hypothetical protein
MLLKLVDSEYLNQYKLHPRSLLGTRITSPSSRNAREDVFDPVLDYDA